MQQAVASLAIHGAQRWRYPGSRHTRPEGIGPDLRRWVGVLAPLACRHSQIRPTRLSHRDSRAHNRDTVWASRFRVHHRVAEGPRKGPILLSGDAVHVHSPAGGQGRNTGIHDTMSLADALEATD